MLGESIKMAWQNITNNKMRSFLTILGIVIGVTAIIALITIVQGVINEVDSQFSTLGAGKLNVKIVGTPLKTGINQNDLKKLEQIENIQGISPTVSSYQDIIGNNILEKQVDVEGKNEIYFNNSSDEIIRGRYLNVLDMDSGNNVCIINDSLEKVLFMSESAVGKNITIHGISYIIVGVLGDNNSDLMSSFSKMMKGETSDGKVIIPYKNAMKLEGTNDISSLEVYVKNKEETDNTISEIEKVLNQSFNYKENSFQIMNMDSLLDTMKQMQNMMQIMLVGIASISLLVGGIGIMNMMLVSVTERTTEIGLRKALGAEPKSIQLQFLIESIFLSCLGGITGILLGILLSFIVSNIIGTSIDLSLGVILLALGFSTGIGIIFGFAPARKASKLNPIDALRSI